MFGRALTTVWILLLLFAVPLAAQYIPPGTSPTSSLVPEEERLRQGLDAAPWRLGVVRLSPWAGLRDVSLVLGASDREDRSTDVTATAGAGLRAYLKNGRRVIWAAHALPEYVFWQDETSKEGLNGRYGLGFFAYLNRLDLEASVRRVEQQQFFSSEVQELTTNRNDATRFAFRLDLTPRLSLGGSWSVTETENQEEGPPVSEPRAAPTLFALLDNEAEAAQLFLSYDMAAGWTLQAGIEEKVTDFAPGARNLSNTGDSLFFGLSYEGPGMKIRASVSEDSLEPRPGSDFVDLETTTGSLETFWDLRRSVALFAYARRQLRYSIENESSNVLADRVGTRLDLEFARARLGLIGEVGEDDYRRIDPASPPRLDEVTAYGAVLALQLTRGLQVSFQGLHTEYDSNLDGFDRQVTTWSSSLVIDVPFESFRLGDTDPDRVW